MEINQNLQNLYSAKLNQKKYNDYQNKVKNGENTDGLFNDADLNKDGKVNSKDLTFINKEITILSKDKTLLDVTGDEKVNINDVIELDVNVDIDGDGQVDENEKAFLEEQKTSLIKQLKAQKDTIEYDFDGDGKVTANDVTSFLKLTERRGDFTKSEDAVDKYLTTLQNDLNKKFFNFDGKKNLSLNDLAIAEQKLQTAMDAIANGSKANYLSEKYIKTSDINKDGTVDAKDVELLEIAVNSIKQANGITTESLDTVKNDYEKALLAYKDAQKAEAAAKAAYKKANKADKAALKEAYVAAAANTKAAKTAYSTQAKEYNKIANYFTTTNKLDNKDNNELLNNYTASVKVSTKDLAKAEKAEVSAQKVYNNVTKELDTVQTKLTNLKNQAANATGSKLNLLNTQIKNLEAKIPSLEKQKADALAALDAAKETTKTKEAELLNVQTINKTLETNDETLINAFNNITEEEKLLIKEQNIDITETFADGSPKYMLAKGKTDKQYHLYKFDAPGSNWATTLIRSAKGYTDSSFAIIAPNNGRVQLKAGSYNNADNQIIIPKKTEVKTETTITKTEFDDLALETNNLGITAEQIERTYNDLSENLKVLIPASENRNETMDKIQQETISSYIKREITKENILPTIADKAVEAGLEGAEVLKNVVTGNNSDKKVEQEKLENILEHLIVDMLDPLTTEVTETITEIETQIGSEISNQKYKTTSPLSFDVNGDGVKTSDAKVAFDIDGDGKLNVINDSADAVLVFDADGNGVAGENGLELFGNITDLNGDGKKDGFANGFDALKALAVKEGLISENDNALNENDLAKLQEKYGLGMKMGYNGEVKSLKDMGVTSINFGATSETQLASNFDGKGNELMTQEGSTFEVNGKTQAYADIWHRDYETFD